MPDDTKKTVGFSDFEREAMKNRAKELAAEAKAAKNKAAGEKVCLEAIAALSETDRPLAEAVHKLITEAAPQLWPKTWYGMPAYALNDKVYCFFQAAEKFKARYATFGFSDPAKLDDGNMWATSFALIKLGDNEKKVITDLVKKAVS